MGNNAASRTSGLDARSQPAGSRSADAIWAGTSRSLLRDLTTARSLEIGTGLTSGVVRGCGINPAKLSPTMTSTVLAGARTEQLASTIPDN
jgi:hypothetical protein